MTSDKYDFDRSRPTHPMYFDKEFMFMQDRSFWGKMVIFLMASMYLKKRYECEYERQRMWDRREGSKTTPAHHFHNRGGVLIKKHFAGFEKYHLNGDEMMSWYTKAYPLAFKKTEEA